MKLTLQQLEPHLQKSLSPIYIISSDEGLLVQETASLIRKAAEKQRFLERKLITVENNSQWETLFSAATESFSLFSSKQIIELNFQNAKFTAAQGKLLQPYAEKPAADILLIIRTAKIDSKVEKSAWFQALEKKSIFLSLWPISQNQYPQWILQRAQKMNLTLTKEMAETIAQQTEGNLLAATQTLEKLLLSPDAIHSQEDDARFNVFDLIETVLAGNASRALRILKNLFFEDVEPTFILWAFAREFRMLADMSQQLKQGIGFSSLFNQYRIYEKRQSSVKAFLQRISPKKCLELISATAHIDRLIKGAEKGSIYNELERLILSATFYTAQ